MFIKSVSSKGYLFSFDTVNKYIDEAVKSDYYTVNAGDKIAQIIYDDEHLVGVGCETFQDSKTHYYRFKEKFSVYVIGGGYSGVTIFL